MMDRTFFGRAAVFLGLLAAGALGSSVVRAQSFQTLSRDGASCVTSTFATDCTPGGTTCSGDQMCVAFNENPTIGQCAPLNIVFCCDPANDSLDCPHNSTCQSVSGLGNGSALCLEAQNYCAEGGAPSAVQVIACLTGLTDFAAPYALGDCDNDGLTNEAELSLSPPTDPCAAPNIAYVEGGQCVTAVPGCSAPGGCVIPPDTAGMCVQVPNGSGTVCVPAAAGELLFCNEQFDCPNATDVTASVNGGLTVCLPNVCPESDPVACVTSTDGSLVAFDNGDCDSDGTSNSAEIEAGTNPCGGGLVMLDAGTSRTDAGPTPVPIEFTGGGGCSCRATPGPIGVPWLLALALVFVLRRRAH